MARHPLAEGAMRALTLAPGIVPVGMLFGATAVGTGLSPLAATTMSALVFAGAAQFASLALYGAGGVASAILLVAVVNARYFLLSAAALDLARRARARPHERSLVALGVVDETYALQAAWAKTAREANAALPPVAGLLVLSLTFWLLWVGGTLAGALVGERLPDVGALGLDYALPGIAVGLLGIFADTRPRLLAGLAALAVAGALAWWGLGTWALLLVPPVFAFALGRWMPGGR